MLRCRSQATPAAMTDDRASMPLDVDAHREAMRLRLRAAMLARDGVTVNVLRALMHALDSLGAVANVPTSVLPQAPGPATEVARRTPTVAEVAARLREEVDEREAAARTFDEVGQPQAAQRLRAEAAVAREWLID